jgi:precorrin-6B methylase 2
MTPTMSPKSRRAAGCAVLLLAGAASSQPAPAPEVPFVPTPQAVVDEMLSMAQVTEKDIIYDLGSGDGRIVITAAQKVGARGVGIDIDPIRIREARENAKKAGVGRRVKFIQQDLFDAKLGEATVVTLYLLQGVNERLRPKLLAELKPGTRVVSHAFDMADWKPVQTRTVQGSSLYLWIVPEREAGTGGAGPAGKSP